MAQKFSDVARAELATNITDVATSFTITSGGALFPVANTNSSAIGPAADWFKVVFVDEDGHEVVYVRTHTSGSTTFSNVLRGQEGTAARSWNATHPVSGRRTIVGLRVSSADYDRFEAKEAPIAAGTTAQYWRGDKTWRDLATDIRASVLTGLSTVSGAVVTAADSVLVAVGKLQKQITDALSSLSSHTNNTDNPHGVTKEQVGLDEVDNVSAAALRSRSTHTGTQSAATITGLATVATSGDYNDLSNLPSIPTDPGGGFAGVTATQTLANKTLGGATKEAVLSTGTDITINDAAVPWRHTTLTANRAVTVSLSVGVSRSLWVNPGTYTVTWPANTLWKDGAAPALPASKWSLITLTGRPGNTDGFAALVWSEP